MANSLPATHEFEGIKNFENSLMLKLSMLNVLNVFVHLLMNSKDGLNMMQCYNDTKNNNRKQEILQKLLFTMLFDLLI